MDSISASLVNKNIVFPDKYSKIKLSENVSLINTFHLNEVQFERGSALATRTKAEDIPTTGFRFFYSKVAPSQEKLLPLFLVTALLRNTISRKVIEFVVHYTTTTTEYTTK